jgi:hypothetical protein
VRTLAGHIIFPRARERVVSGPKARFRPHGTPECPRLQFVADSLVERGGFEPSVPRKRDIPNSRFSPAPNMIEEVRFAVDSLLEGSGFELLVPREIGVQGGRPLAALPGPYSAPAARRPWPSPLGRSKPTTNILEGSFDPRTSFVTFGCHWWKPAIFDPNLSAAARRGSSVT